METPSREIASGLENLTVNSSKKPGRTGRSNSFHVSPYRNVSKPQTKLDKSGPSRATRKLPLFDTPGVDASAEENTVVNPSRKEPDSPVKASARPHKKGKPLQESNENVKVGPRRRTGSLIDRPTVPSVPQPKERRYRTVRRTVDGAKSPALEDIAADSAMEGAPAAEQRQTVPLLPLGSLAFDSPIPTRLLPLSPLAFGGDTESSGTAVTSVPVAAPTPIAAAAPTPSSTSRLPSSRRRSFIGGLLALVTPRGASPSARDRADSAGSLLSSYNLAQSASSAPPLPPAPQLDDPEMYYGAVGVFGERRSARSGSPGPQPVTASSLAGSSSLGNTRARSSSSPAPMLVRQDSASGSLSSLAAAVMPTGATLPKLLQWLLDARDEKMEQRFFLSCSTVGPLSNVSAAFLELYKGWKHLGPYEKLRSVLGIVEFFIRWINFTPKGTAQSFAVGNEALKVARELCLDSYDTVSREAHRLYKLATAKSSEAVSTSVVSVERLLPTSDVPFVAIRGEDAANCLTKMEHQFFAAVPDEEWLSCGWMKNNRSVYPNLYMSICHFNRLSHWSTTTVLRAADGKERTEVIRRMMKLIKLLFRLHNYNTPMALICGLSQSSVSKLPEWDKLSTRRLEQHLQLLDPSANSRNYREVYLKHFANISVPYVCLFLKDIASASECNAGLIEGGLINWQRLYLLGGFLLELKSLAQRELSVTYTDETWRYFASLPDAPEAS